MAKIYSVTKVNAYIKNMFMTDFALSNISIEGEVSNCKYHTRGHIYFTLKDEASQISCIMFAGKTSTGLKSQIKDGMKVVVTGSVEAYEKGGTYQIYANIIEEAGIGDLYQKYLALKNKLEKEGLFDKQFKKTKPEFATRIGIVTSQTGAAIQDIINVSKRRNPYVELILYPALVQGDNAYLSIIKGIKYLDELALDIIIIGRGGGSIEDLWAFNEEALAKAIFEAKTFIISAVGHETDFTISDFTADLRAATPSQAAEIANFDYYNFIKTISDFDIRFKNSLKSKIEISKRRVSTYQYKLSLYSPSKRLNQYRTYLNEISTKFEKRMYIKLNNIKSYFTILVNKLESLSPLKQISSGYAYISNSDNKRISKVQMLEEKEILNIQFFDGKAQAQVLKIECDKEKNC